MTTKSMTMKLCTYMGAIAGTMMFVGIWPVAHMFPPLDPSMPAAEAAAYYRSHQIGILAGAILIASSSVLFFPFLAAIATFAVVSVAAAIARPPGQWYVRQHLHHCHRWRLRRRRAGL